MKTEMKDPWKITITIEGHGDDQIKRSFGPAAMKMMRTITGELEDEMMSELDERRFDALKKAGWNLTKASKSLNISVAALSKWATERGVNAKVRKRLLREGRP